MTDPNTEVEDLQARQQRVAGRLRARQESRREERGDGARLLEELGQLGVPGRVGDHREVVLRRHGEHGLDLGEPWVVEVCLVPPGSSGGVS